MTAKNLIGWTVESPDGVLYGVFASEDLATVHATHAGLSRFGVRPIYEREALGVKLVFNRTQKKARD